MIQNKKIVSYRDLEVWQRAKQLVIRIYSLTEKFPHAEEYGLANQIRRSAVSIPSNIAEGFLRRSHKEKINFMRIAFASGAELETHLEISRDLNFAAIQEYKEIVSELDVVMKMLNKAIKAVAGANSS